MAGNPLLPRAQVKIPCGWRNHRTAFYSQGRGRKLSWTLDPSLITSWVLLLLREEQETLVQDQPWKAEVAAFQEAEKVPPPKAQAHRSCLRLRLDQGTENLHTDSESLEWETVYWGGRERVPLWHKNAGTTESQGGSRNTGKVWHPSPHIM